MTSPLLSTLAAAVNSAMQGVFLDAVLTRHSFSGGSPDASSYDPTPAAPVTYTCKAIRDQYGVGHRSGGLVQSNDVKVLILQGSLSVTPQSGDQISISGFGGPWIIVPADSGGQPAVSADPANALWECRCRI